MSLSISAVERANPPPRRKSCNACIKAKRRCDYGQPACVRCAHRNLSCVYPSGSLQYLCRRLANEVSPSDRLQQTTPDMSLTGCGASSVAEELSTWWNGEMLGSSLINIDVPTLVSPSAGAYIDPPDCILDGFAEPRDEIFLNDIHKLDALDLGTSLSPICSRIGEDSQSRMPQIIAARLQYAIDEIKEAPRRMVLETQTPWCHPQLYQAHMPRSMLDAHSSCALYMAKNEFNAQNILRSIEARIDDLLASPKPASSMEMLARVQCLLLYQIIRIFDSDFRVSASIEKTERALEDATILLMSYLNSEHLSRATEYIALLPLEETRNLWTSWIFVESARRTLTITLFFVQLRRLLSGNVPFRCDGKLHICNSWTLSAHLWNAENLFDFNVAWRDKKHFVIKNGIFSQVIRDAEADDIEVFGRILLTLLMGIDETKAWFASKGGVL